MRWILILKPGSLRLSMRLLCTALFCAVNPVSAEDIAIVQGKSADNAQATAVKELALFLGELYPGSTFPVHGELPASGKYILVGTRQTVAEIAKYVTVDEVSAPGSFVVKNVENGGVGVICGNHSRAVLDGVYALLENLGCGFYLEYNFTPVANKDDFSFEKWALRDAPLVQDRFLFNWHNFISGCTGWNLEHYRKWVLQASRMGYNGIKLHFYGNNPAFQFSLNGETKPVGFMGSTQKGPEWGVPLLNDVRRLPGADFLENPVFASDVALVDDEQRVEASVKLLQQAMEYADSLGMKIHLGVDMDHYSCNPINIIETLPDHARFKGGTLVRPDTPEGHEYYKVQFKTLLDLYPQLDTIIIWSRGEWTEWLTLAYEDLPEDWQKEYDAFKAKHPGLNTLHPWKEYNFPKDKGPSHFAYTKITTAALKIVKELGRMDVEIGYGGWWPRTSTELWRLHNFVEDPAVSFWVKDYSRDFGRARIRQVYKEISGTRKIYPIDWAHHDDGHYVGRPYHPHPDFGDMLLEAGVPGFGIVHWLTWPLDIFVKNLMHQAWENTRNESHEATCLTMAEQVFGKAYKDVMGEYLADWWANAPSFGRSTSQQYISNKSAGEINILKNAGVHLSTTRERIRKLEGIDTCAMTPDAKKFYDYFLLNEKFIEGIADSSLKLRKVRERIRKGDLPGAREVMQSCDHIETIRLFSKAAQAVGPSRGEAGHLIRIASVWGYSYDFVSAQLGLQPIGYNFGPIPFDDFAIGAVNQKFYFDREGSRWAVHDALLIENGGQITKTKPSGVVELDGESVDLGCYRVEEIRDLPPAISSAEEVAATFVESDKSIQLKLRAVLEDLVPGQYDIELFFPASMVTAKGERIIKITLATVDGPIVKEVDLFAGSAPVKTVSLTDLAIDQPVLAVSIEGLKGKAVISGAKLMLVRFASQAAIAE